MGSQEAEDRHMHMMPADKVGAFYSSWAALLHKDDRPNGIDGKTVVSASEREERQWHKGKTC